MRGGWCLGRPGTRAAASITPCCKQGECRRLMRTACLLRLLRFLRSRRLRPHRNSIILEIIWAPATHWDLNPHNRLTQGQSACSGSILALIGSRARACTCSVEGDSASVCSVIPQPPSGRLPGLEHPALMEGMAPRRMAPAHTRLHQQPVDRVRRCSYGYYGTRCPQQPAEALQQDLYCTLHLGATAAYCSPNPQ